MRILVLAVSFLLAAGFAAAADIDGKWSGETEVMGQTAKMDYTFKADGKKLTGTGPGPEEPLELKDGKIDGDKISFVLEFDMQGMKMKFNYKGVVSGDEIKLTYEMEMPGGDGGFGGGMGGAPAAPQGYTIKRVK